ncbi:hypothetical protein ACIQRS_25680 [Streptomyces termitum]|uniref:Uncharacterized protein n=1 Tax=Streptomyces termitum TaxID=67368 RepID=A0A918T7U9_9ACTN|nr:hypothetical protein [Streptomyces termitum]GHB07134.1 hypothetical protein GCM10010305_57810 [Streptomyces termitum]
MLTVLGILFAVVPVVVWVAIARSRSVGFPVGGVLFAGAGLLVGVQRGWIDAPGPDAHLVFTVLAPLLIACGAGLEGRNGSAPPPEWISRRNGAVGFLGAQFALTLVAGLLYALLISEGSDAPSARNLPALPPGITKIGEGTSCGSGGCWRTATVIGEDGLSHAEIIHALGLQREKCRPSGWLLDWRDVCVGARADGENVTVYAGWGY